MSRATVKPRGCMMMEAWKGKEGLIVREAVKPKGRLMLEAMEKKGLTAHDIVKSGEWLMMEVRK